MISGDACAARGADSSAHREDEIALVVLPFGTFNTPSLAASLLRAQLTRTGISSRVHYLNLDFAERIGTGRYEHYAADMTGAFLGEWIFSDCLFPRTEEDSERYVEEVLIPLGRYSLDHLADFERDRALARPFLEECLATRDWGRYRAVGITTVFQQNTASLAFARMIKLAHPGTAIVFGGANCEGAMGAQLLQSFPWIDFVCTGEGDDAFPELALQITGRKPEQAIPGILRRGSGPGPPAPTSPPMVADLDRLPFPDVSDYFERIGEWPDQPRPACCITMETSRGCWWGEKHHCTFCGLNGLTMRFRSKSPERAQREIAHFAGLYKPLLNPVAGLLLSDNILDLNYFRSLMPALRDAGLGVGLFYETKANLSLEQVRMLAEAGIHEIQPGIESLHTGLLKLMRKGCTALQNIQLLKWCRAYGIHAHWNLLFGFPGEDPRWFEEQARVVPRVRHLRPPICTSPVRLDRFSPYFVDAQAYGIENVRPMRALTYIYALPAAELHGLAYHFDFDFADGRDPLRYMGPLREAVEQWRQLEKEVFFCALPLGDRLVLWDGRGSTAPAHRVLMPEHRRLYEFCDKIRSGSEIVRFAAEGLGMAEAEARGCLTDWVEAGLMITEDDRFLSLAVLVLDAERAPHRPRQTQEMQPVASTADSPAARASARPCRRAGMRSLSLAEGTIVLDRSAGHALVLEGLAAEAWTRCDGRRSVAAIVDEISSRDLATSRPSAREVDRVLGELVARGLLELDRFSG